MYVYIGNRQILDECYDVVEGEVQLTPEVKEWRDASIGVYGIPLPLTVIPFKPQDTITLWEGWQNEVSTHPLLDPQDSDVLFAAARTVFEENPLPEAVIIGWEVINSNGDVVFNVLFEGRFYFELTTRRFCHV